MIRDLFFSQTISDEDLKDLIKIREVFAMAAEEIIKTLKPSAYRTLAIRDLEKSAMWTTKGISHVDVEMDRIY